MSCGGVAPYITNLGTGWKWAVGFSCRRFTPLRFDP